MLKTVEESSFPSADPKEHILRDLGANALELLPLTDSKKRSEWGYGKLLLEFKTL